MLTCLFYSALHYVEAYNAKSDCHFSNHVDRNRDIEKNPTLSGIWMDYRDLSTLSWNARYQSTKYGEDKLVEARQSFEAIRDHIAGLL